MPVSEEETKAWEAECAKIKAENAKVQERNEVVKKLGEKIKIEWRSHDYADNNECAIVRIENFREPPAEEEEGEGQEASKDHSKANVSKGSQRETDVDLGFDSMPGRVILAAPRSQDFDTVMIHTEASIELR